jgi:hypothetical protein
MADLSRLERRIADTQARLAVPERKHTRAQRDEQTAAQRYLDGLRDALADVRAGEATALPIEVTAHPHVWATLLRLVTCGAEVQKATIRDRVTAHQLRHSEAAAWNADNHTAFMLLLDTIRAACAAQPQRRQWFPEGLLDPPTTEQRSGEA